LEHSLENGYPTLWAKSAQISKTEFLLIGGKDKDNFFSKKCYLLDTRTQTLVEKSELPIPLAAHVVCYFEAKGKLQGTGINCAPTV